MRFAAAHAAAPAHLALMRHDELHAGRLAHDAARRCPAFRDDIGDEPAHTNAPDLLVVRQREMQRPRESATYELWHECQPDCRKALHVGRAAAVQTSIFQPCLEGRRIPWLAVDGNHIGMTRQHDTVGRRIAVAGGQRREQVGLAARIIERERR